MGHSCRVNTALLTCFYQLQGHMQCRAEMAVWSPAEKARRGTWRCPRPLTSAARAQLGARREGWEGPVDRGANPGRAGGCRERGRDLRAGGREARAREEGQACVAEPAGDGEAETGHRPPRVPAQATRPRGRGADGRAVGPARRRRPAMFSRSSRKRVSSRSLTGLGRIERGQPCNACGDQCPGFALHKWSLSQTSTILAGDI
ncbi:uncharacterized protein LOC122424375 [Cervus canadensis]|uniref:uncharacterized protein LOC122424375 n=1 Tax=Cervus canadensis TaxID=1574408 RepID=UPI001CA31526|nr:uncharacterized protein LOC122424375 [Cervus canadensis]